MHPSRAGVGRLYPSHAGGDASARSSTYAFAAVTLVTTAISSAGSTGFAT
jgi:hypothetical protein